jgi:hypothetical protein
MARAFSAIFVQPGLQMISELDDQDIFFSLSRPANLSRPKRLEQPLGQHIF